MILFSSNYRRYKIEGGGEIALFLLSQSNMDTERICAAKNA